jgi:hypothetical protein
MIPITPIQRALLEEYHRPRTDRGKNYTPEDYIFQIVTWEKQGGGDWKQLAEVYDWPVALVETLKDSITQEQREAVETARKKAQEWQRKKK